MQTNPCRKFGIRMQFIELLDSFRDVQRGANRIDATLRRPRVSLPGAQCTVAGNIGNYTAVAANCGEKWSEVIPHQIVQIRKRQTFGNCGEALYVGGKTDCEVRFP